MTAILQCFSIWYKISIEVKWLIFMHSHYNVFILVTKLVLKWEIIDFFCNDKYLTALYFEEKIILHAKVEHKTFVALN